MQELIQNITRVLRAGPPLRLAVLFGSLAKGRATPRSDVDLAILPLDPELSLREEGILVADLEGAVGRPVDLVRIDRAPGALRWQIASTGLLLHAEPAWEWTRFRAGEASAHADIADALERNTRLFLRRLARPAR